VSLGDFGNPPPSKDEFLAAVEYLARKVYIREMSGQNGVVFGISLVYEQRYADIRVFEFMKAHVISLIALAFAIPAFVMAVIELSRTW
jgi:hypothetical protein